jgi:hypothetical protein
MFEDSRVTSFWDGDRLAGRWFADHETGGLSAPGSIVWDAYLAYGPRARWSRAPTKPIVAGSDIIAHTAGLQRFAATLIAG